MIEKKTLNILVIIKDSKITHKINRYLYIYIYKVIIQIITISIIEFIEIIGFE